MRTKKMLFKAAVCLMAVVIMMFSTVSALAAADYYTTTTYNLSTGEVTVKTTVTNVAANDEIAYIAYTGGNPEDDDAIFYIDQITAEEGNNVIEYTAPAEKIADDTHVMLVGTTAGKLSEDQTDAIKFGTDYTLTVVATNGKVALADAADAANKTEVDNKTAEIKVGNGNEIIYQLTAAEGFDDTNPVVTLVDGQGAAIAHENKTFKVTGDATLTVTFSKTETKTEAVEEEEVNDAEKELVDVTTNTNVNTGEVVETKAITKFGTMTIGDTACAAYGIELSDTADFANKEVFNGLGTWADLTDKNGRFAIVIEGTPEEFENVTYYIRTFVTVGDNTTYGKVFEYVNGVGEIYTAPAAN